MFLKWGQLQGVGKPPVTSH